MTARSTSSRLVCSRQDLFLLKHAGSGGSNRIFDANSQKRFPQYSSGRLSAHHRREKRNAIMGGCARTSWVRVERPILEVGAASPPLVFSAWGGEVRTWSFASFWIALADASFDLRRKIPPLVAVSEPLSNFWRGTWNSGDSRTPLAA